MTTEYHQKRAQGLYGAMARIYSRERNYDIRSAGNFCCENADASAGTSDHRLAIQGMVELLHLPKGADPFAEDPAATGAPDETRR